MKNPVFFIKKSVEKKKKLRVLTKAICENIFSRIENRVRRFSFIRSKLVLK